MSVNFGQHLDSKKDTPEPEKETKENSEPEVRYVACIIEQEPESRFKSFMRWVEAFLIGYLVCSLMKG